MDLEMLARTRRSLHGVAEGVLAGPQYRATGTIRLRPSSHGFATVAAPALAVEGTDLVAGDRRLPLEGTYRSLALAAGVEWGPPEGLYHDHSGVDADEPVEIEASSAATLAAWLARADEALRQLAPGETPVLWPEHFDLAVTVDEVNYGASCGDAWSTEPYAYVGPWVTRTGDFWDAPFGAARRMSALPDAEAVLAFYAEGRRRAVAG